MNCAARLVCRASKREHNIIRPLQGDLRWLPVSHRIEYKVAAVCYNVILGSAPPLSCWPPSAVHSLPISLLICWSTYLSHSNQQEISGAACLFWYWPCPLKHAPISCPPCSNSVDFQIPAKKQSLLCLLPSAIGPAVNKSQSICVCVCMCVCVRACVCVERVCVGESSWVICNCECIYVGLRGLLNDLKVFALNDL